MPTTYLDQLDTEQLHGLAALLLQHIERLDSEMLHREPSNQQLTPRNRPVKKPIETTTSRIRNDRGCSDQELIAWEIVTCRKTRDRVNEPDPVSKKTTGTMRITI